MFCPPILLELSAISLKFRLVQKVLHLIPLLACWPALTTSYPIPPVSAALNYWHFLTGSWTPQGLTSQAVRLCSSGGMGLGWWRTLSPHIPVKVFRKPWSATHVKISWFQPDHAVVVQVPGSDALTHLKEVHLFKPLCCPGTHTGALPWCPRCIQ